MRVVMLVNNPCTRDTRVIKEAETLADAGHTVLVLAHWNTERPADTWINGVNYRHICVNRLQRNSRRLFEKKPALAEVADRPDNRTTPTNISTRNSKSKLLRSAIRHILVAFLTATLIQLVRHATHYTRPAISWQADVVHAHDLYTLLAGYLISRKTGARLVYDSHELEVGRNGNFSRWERWWRGIFEGFLITRTTRVITVSDSIADYLQAHYQITRPVVVLNAPQTRDEIHGKDHIRSRLGLGKEKPLAIYVGMATINRGLENCIHALVFAQQLHFAIIGPRTALLETTLIELAEKLGVEGRVHLIDPVPHDHVVGFLRSADVSIIAIQNVCLSYQYCFPNKLLESLFAGIPVAVARLVELERMVKLTSAGLVIDESDPKSIAEGVMKIIDERQHYAPDSKMLLWLKQHYGWSAQQKILTRLYEELNTRGC